MGKYVKLFEEYNDEINNPIIQYLIKVRKDLLNFVPDPSAERIPKSLHTENFELVSSHLISTYWKFPSWNKNYDKWEESDDYKYEQIFKEWAKQFKWCGQFEDESHMCLCPVDDSQYLHFDVFEHNGEVEFAIRIE